MKKATPSDYNPSKIESKWRNIWEKNKAFQVDLNSSSNSEGKPYYNLMMFPYPSAEGLHVGNMYAFTGSDIWGRYMRMRGYDVFEPIGLDGFGIHSENYAIKVGKHPAKQAKISEKNFYRQLKMIGNQFSWDNKLETYDPDYYKWTQWIFIQMFKAGLAYRKKSPVNWCPSCKTVLADEQVINEKCERCDSRVEQRDLEQWFFKITKYADRLLENLKKIDWTEKVKIAQRNWIGKKEGINITYQVKSTPKTITCFTTRPDTNFGATFIVLAPEHQLVDQITSKDSKKAVGNYVKQALKKSKTERIAEGTSKTGIFTGAYCINQLTGKHMPVWISDFVLMEVGTGAVVGVPGHDLRDFEFAKKFDLPIIRVVAGLDDDRSKITKASQVQEKEGKMINSDFLNGMDIHKATQKIMDYIEKKGWGKKTVSYHIRDWLISRQRYWGPPIPMICCKKCGWFPVPEKDLPVLLPDVKDWRPKGTGRGPLAQLKDWVNVKCPHCDGPAKRETDVSDTFLDSAWYFLRYPSTSCAGSGQAWVEKSGKDTLDVTQSGSSETEDSNKPWDSQITRCWLPVNMYIGGAEHSVLHLLYSRFLTMVFKDLGYLDFEEPFTKFRAHGLIIKDGAKMSKSKGNIVNPDEYIKKYGADTLRCYLMFLGHFKQGGDFRDTGIKGMYKFLSRVWRLVASAKKTQRLENSSRKCEEKENPGVEIDKEELYWIHKTIKKVTDSISRLKYNTAISSLMEYVNFLVGAQRTESASQESIKTLILLLAPFTPHLSEELWQRFRCSRIDADNSVHNHLWPKYNSEYIKEDQVEIVIQVNGKVRDRIKVPSEQSENKAKILILALKSAKIQNYLKNKKLKKTFFISGKLINLVG